MECRYSLPYSQEPVAGPYPKPLDSLGITGFVDWVHHLVFGARNLIQFCPQTIRCRGGFLPWLEITKSIKENSYEITLTLNLWMNNMKW
jgi:hypothetical protein